MMSWDDLRCLACVGRGQTLTSAARTLQTSISTVSRRIERLNNDSSEQIAIKNGNTWTLTNHGKQIAEAAIKFQEQLDKAEADSIDKGKGKLKPRVITLTAPDAHILPDTGSNRLCQQRARHRAEYHQQPIWKTLR